jgi:hypothetical protein
VCSARRRASTCTQTQKNAHTTQTLNINALSGIQTHVPGVRASEDSSCLRPLDYHDRHRLILEAKNYQTKSITWQANSLGHGRLWIQQINHKTYIYFKCENSHCGYKCCVIHYLISIETVARLILCHDGQQNNGRINCILGSSDVEFSHLLYSWCTAMHNIYSRRREADEHQMAIPSTFNEATRTAVEISDPVHKPETLQPCTSSPRLICKDTGAIFMYLYIGYEMLTAVQ